MAIGTLGVALFGGAHFASALLGAEKGAHGTGSEWGIERRLDLVKGGTFQFSVPVGSVVIENHKEAHVEYLGEFKAKSKREADRLFPLIEELSSTKGNQTELVFQWKNKKSPRKSNLSGKHLIRLPQGVDIEIRTAGGSIVVADRIGAVTLKSSGGSLRLGKVDGMVAALTSGGSISVGHCNGDASLKTSGGSIKAGNVNGSLSAQTSGGKISIGSVSGHLDAKTSGGSINARLENQIQRPVSLMTSGGSISLVVNPNFKAVLDAKTSGGRVICDLPLEVSGKFSKRAIEGAVNGGGPKITMKTSGGNIVLKKM
ncbi:DUF4097 domain-containing protein [Verrucomicrobia bacterium]|jgi:DUF4097 and DUF4098 domain-containing protein YvlB|nr:DUF4097 domain-containing protein [Verrucomicrobiota bacterium]